MINYIKRKKKALLAILPFSLIMLIVFIHNPAILFVVLVCLSVFAFGYGIAQL